MNFSMKGIGFRRLLSNQTIQSGYVLLLVLLLGAPVTGAARTTPHLRLTSGHDSLAVADTPSASRLQVAVYQVHNSTQIKVHFAHKDSSPVKIRLENDKGAVLYTETVDHPVYIRKFDLSALPDARYYFTLQTEAERQVKEVVLQTRAIRNLEVR